MAFVPALEIEERENKLFVKADLPGMKKEAVKVEVAPEGLTITGERKEEKEEKKEGYFRTERLYGTFERFVPLPDGAVLDKAAAEFKDGVLTVAVPLGAVPKPEVKTLPIA
jgi:HSP20 family protein